MGFGFKNDVSEGATAKAGFLIECAVAKVGVDPVPKRGSVKEPNDWIGMRRGRFPWPAPCFNQG